MTDIITKEEIKEILEDEDVHHSMYEAREYSPWTGDVEDTDIYQTRIATKIISKINENIEVIASGEVAKSIKSLINIKREFILIYDYLHYRLDKKLDELDGQNITIFVKQNKKK